MSANDIAQKKQRSGERPDADVARRDPRSAFRHPHSLLAWAGWRLGMPREWQPLKLTGTAEKGQVIVGDASCAIFIVRWERPRARAVPDAKQWVVERLKKHGVQSDANPPASAHFTACGWARDVQTEEEKQTTFWYGFSRPAGLALGVTVNGVLPKAVRRRVVDRVLPTLRATPSVDATMWSMYDVSFTVPPGFMLLQRHLFSGDLALEFGRGRRETLLVRQVYPGDLALERRSLEKWLDAYPFKEHRRLRRATRREIPWKHDTRAELAGIRRTGRKRLGAPLGWCAPRWTCALAAHDRTMNRLLIAEHMASAQPDASVCVRAIEAMNREHAAA